MQNYTIKAPKKQGQTPYFSRSTHLNCKPYSRCKQIHKCEVCHKIHTKKMMTKYLGNINDTAILSKYKQFKFITITPKSLDDDFEVHNSNIDFLSKDLSNSSKRRYKNHPFFNSDYLIFKEITKSSLNNNMLPHLHIILLTNNTNLLFDNPLFDYDIKDIKIELNDNYKNDYDNPLTQTLKKLFAYSNKVDKDRLFYERTFNTSYKKSDIKASSFFTKPHNLFPIHIKIKDNILKTIAEARKQALKEHREYKKAHPRAKGITIHKHALKTKRKLIKLEKKKKELLARYERKLKVRSTRQKRRLLSTHYIKSSP